MIDSIILLLEVYNTISGSMQYYQRKYTIISILHSVYMYSVDATQLWFRVRVPFVDFLLNNQTNSSSITKDNSADFQSQCPPPQHIPLELCNSFQHKFISKTCNLHQFALTSMPTQWYFLATCCHNVSVIDTKTK